MVRARLPGRTSAYDASATSRIVPVYAVAGALSGTRTVTSTPLDTFPVTMTRHRTVDWRCAVSRARQPARYIPDVECAVRVALEVEVAPPVVTRHRQRSLKPEIENLLEGERRLHDLQRQRAVRRLRPVRHAHPERVRT